MAEALIFGLILHFVGDYLLQNDWMAQNKTKDSLACLIHCALYAAPFGFILLDRPFLWWTVFATHFFIDRFRLAVYWIKLVNWNWQSKNFGFDDAKPLWMSVWLMIVIDNTLHIIINSGAIALAFK